MAGISPAIAAILCLASTAAAAAAAGVVIVDGKATLLSPHRTFELGFFSVDDGGAWYLGIWYASIPIRTYVWVANRDAPAGAERSAFITPTGKLAVSDVWATDNAEPGAGARLLDSGNLVLVSGDGTTVWQSFDSPADTWLPEMAVTRLRPLVSWRSRADPSPGFYSLRLSPPEYGEFELVFNGSERYWSTGNWSGERFAAVPEMTVSYIYDFLFQSPFTPEASFVYNATKPLLTRFAVEPSGQLKQFTWSKQTESWSMFWSRPDGPCRVYARCGVLGLCGGGLRPCSCPAGLRPAAPAAWSSGDYSGGCTAGVLCGSGDDQFSELGAVEFDAALAVPVRDVSRSNCEDSCRRNCSCFGIIYDPVASLCRNLYGSGYNLRNSTAAPVLYVRIPGGNSSNTGSAKSKLAVVIGCSVAGLIAAAASLALLIAVAVRRRRRGKGDADEDEEFPVTNLRFFTYKELSAATRGFSDKLGHGGFGAVFRGEIPPSSTAVAVKRLERPGGGEREFRAEVRTIGSVQHVNLVRLRGFCSEERHRLLVYDYMPNGPLSAYLGRERRRLSWAARFRIATGTARGIAYLHESCRDCIIHCDIKPENILLDEGMNAKVSDFGLAKLVGRDMSRVLATMRGTWGYVAPEWISGTAITVKADVYSYGMTLLEILSGRRNAEAPVGEAAEEAEGWFFPPTAARRIVEGDVGGVMDAGLKDLGGYDEAEAERAGRVAVWCVQDEEADRPAMGDVVKMLGGAVEVAVPPLPQLLQALVSGESFRRARIGGGTDESEGRVSTGSEEAVCSATGSGSYRSTR